MYHLHHVIQVHKILIRYLNIALNVNDHYSHNILQLMYDSLIIILFLLF